MSASDAENVCLEQPSKQAKINSLIESIEAYEALGGEIAAETSRLGLDVKKLRAIRSTKRTLDALMGIDPATAERVSK